MEPKILSPPMKKTLPSRDKTIALKPSIITFPARLRLIENSPARAFIGISIQQYQPPDNEKVPTITPNKKDQSMKKIENIENKLF